MNPQLRLLQDKVRAQLPKLVCFRSSNAGSLKIAPVVCLKDGFLCQFLADVLCRCLGM